MRMLLLTLALAGLLPGTAWPLRATALCRAEGDAPQPPAGCSHALVPRTAPRQPA